MTIVYYSEKNHTFTLAQAIAAGALSVNGTIVTLVSIDEADMQLHVLPADALVIGAPVHFGNVASEFLLWVEQSWAPYWQAGALRGKVGGVFTTGGGIAQGVEHVLASLQRTLQSYSVRVLVPDPTTSAYTSYGCFAATATPPFNLTGSAIAQPFLDVATAYGAQIATAAAEEKRWRGL